MKLDRMRIEIIPTTWVDHSPSIDVRFEVSVFGKDKITMGKIYFPDDFVCLFDRIFDDAKRQIHDFLKEDGDVGGCDSCNRAYENCECGGGEE